MVSKFGVILAIGIIAIAFFASGNTLTTGAQKLKEEVRRVRSGTSSKDEVKDRSKGERN